ncbi:MAG: hypothetical protein IPK32_20350 [Verrucomicrobiaceae bacterium]|nr:hypothetical protein [Verrucomicrobiaceae bacterium]
MRLYTLSASSYHGGTSSSGEVQMNWPPGLDFRDQDVLLLDDILDTGLTLSVLRGKIAAQNPTTLRTAVLLAKKRERVCEVAGGHRLRDRGRVRRRIRHGLPGPLP